MENNNNYEDIINQFIVENGFTSDNDFIGVIFYGSREQGISSSDSDLDLIVISGYGDKETIKGMYKIDKIKIKYFIRTIDSLYERINYDYNSYSDSILSILGYGKICIDKTGEIQIAQDYVLELYKNGLKPIDSDYLKYEMQDISDKIEVLANLKRLKSPQFNPFYFALLEQIRSLYHKRFGYSDISRAKVYNIYTNDLIAIKQHKALPPIEFRRLYVIAITTNDLDEMTTTINEMFYMCSDGFCIEADSYKIKLGRRKY